MAQRKKTFLISGGAGFVGSHLAENLVDKGHRVIVLDDFSNGRRENLSGIDRSMLRIVRGDITWPLPRLERLLRGFRIGGIFHLACFPRSMSLADPQRDAEVNGIGAIHMLQLAQRHRCKLVYTSNSGILGDPQYTPLDERHPDNPTTPYDANKLVAEYYCRIFHQIHGVPVAVVRLATVYGERQRTKPDWKPLIAEFVDKLRHNRRPIITWDGNQTRDFVYVKDIVQGLTKAFRARTSDDYCLLGTNVETSVNQLFRVVAKVLDKQHILPVRKPRVPGDIRRMRLSYRKAQRAFDYRPRYSLEQGVRNYVQWISSQSS